MNSNEWYAENEALLHAERFTINVNDLEFLTANGQRILTDLDLLGASVPIYYPLPNQFTMSANVNYPTSNDAKYVHWNTLNGTTIAPTGTATIYTPYMLASSALDYTVSADTGVDSNATWFTIVRSGIYNINFSIIYDDQNTTAYYQQQIVIKRGGVDDGLLHGATGDGQVLNSDIKVQHTQWTGRLNAGDSWTIMVVFSAALDMIAQKALYGVKSRLEFARLV